MNISEKVEERIKELKDNDSFDMNEALLLAEKLADEYSDVEPVPYIVPIERMVGIRYIADSEECSPDNSKGLLPF